MPDFPALAAAAGVSKPWLAAQTGRSLGTVKRWWDGTASAPAEVLAWIHRRLADPPPAVPDRRRRGT